MLAGPFQITAPTLAAAGRSVEWVPAPSPDPYGFEVFEWAERELARHYGIPHEQVRAALTDLDLQWEQRTGSMYFEQHLNHAFGWSLVAESLLIKIRDETGIDYSAAGPYPVTFH